MNQNQFRNMLRHAVIAALPLSTVMACVTTAPPAASDSGTKPLPAVDDPCRQGETTRQSAQESFSAQIELLEKPLSAEQCLELCKQTFTQNRVGGWNDLYKLERLEASDCRTENRPYSDVIPGGRFPRPSTLISCQVSYTAIHSPYTCPKPVPGRVPHGLHVSGQQAASHNRTGQYLSAMAAMETAAITAFEYLGRELEAYGAPAELIARARQAVEEESRHAEMAGLLAATYEAVVPEVRVDDFQLRSLYEIALENAVEGCVNETFAAACGLWQSQHAGLDVFRAVIGHITDEEIGHADLSWDIHRWVMPQLSEPEQARIREAQAEAVASLLADFRQEGDPAVQQAFGLPTRDEAGRLFAQLQASVWGDLGRPN